MSRNELIAGNANLKRTIEELQESSKVHTYDNAKKLLIACLQCVAIHS